MDVRTQAPRLIRGLLRAYLNGQAGSILPETPERAARGLAELLSGYKDDPRRHVRLFESDLDEIVVVRGISFASVCEHHVLPFWGIAHVAYIPCGRILGLSKFARIVNVFSRRLQTQERLTQEAAKFLEGALKPLGLAVIMRAIHSCAVVRGVRDQGIELVTSSMLGKFRKSPAARMELLALLQPEGLR